jgi:hypothetical protein
MTLDRQPAAAVERRLEERAIHTITPIRTMAPSTIHSQTRLFPDSAGGVVAAGAGVAAGSVVGSGVGLAVTGSLAGGWVGWLGGWLGRMLAVRLGKLEITLLAALPHPAARHPRTTITAARMSRRGIRRCMPGRPSSLALKRATRHG